MPPTFDFMGSKPPESSAARRCWIEGRRVHLELKDDRVVSFPASKYPLLARAHHSKLKKVELRLNGRALRWEALDEDIWVDDAVRGRFPRSREKAAV